MYLGAHFHFAHFLQKEIIASVKPLSKVSGEPWSGRQSWFVGGICWVFLPYVLSSVYL